VPSVRSHRERRGADAHARGLRTLIGVVVLAIVGVVLIRSLRERMAIAQLHA